MHKKTVPKMYSLLEMKKVYDNSWQSWGKDIQREINEHNGKLQKHTYCLSQLM